MPELPKTAVEWLSCLSLPDYLAMTPTGHHVPIVGPEIWVDGTGAQLSRDHYIAKWGVDPKIGWEAVKAYRRESGKNDKTVRL